MRENLLVIAQTYADAKGWSLATVSKQIHGNQSFLTEFMAGNVSCGIGTYEQMLDRLRVNWIAGLAWPKTRDVPAPKRRPYRPAAETTRGPGGKFLPKRKKKGVRRA